MEIFEFYITIQTSINHSQCCPVVVYYQKNDDTCIVWLVYGVNATFNNISVLLYSNKYFPINFNEK